MGPCNRLIMIQLRNRLNRSSDLIETTLLVTPVRRREVLVEVEPEAAAVGPVHGQLGADRAAEERAGRHAERLADDVEQGVLDGADGLQGSAGQARVLFLLVSSWSCHYTGPGIKACKFC